LRACQAVLRPVALAVGRGLLFGDVAEVLKQCFVEAARAAHPGVVPNRAVEPHQRDHGREPPRGDAVDAARRTARPPRAPSPATQSSRRWLSDPRCSTPKARPSHWRRRARPSFESLANSSPATCIRARCWKNSPASASPAWTKPTAACTCCTAPSCRGADLDRMLAFLGANVGDHLAAAVDNVLSDGSRHFEQACSPTNCRRPRWPKCANCVSSEWQRLLHTLAPALQALIDADKAPAAAADQRLRIGLFAYTDAMAPAPIPRPHRPSHLPRRIPCPTCTLPARTAHAAPPARS
jgi:hypothetical protein